MLRDLSELFVIGHMDGVQRCAGDNWVIVFNYYNQYVFQEINIVSGAVSEKVMYHPTTSAVLTQPITPSGYTIHELLLFNELDTPVSHQSAGEADPEFISNSGPTEYIKEYIAIAPDGVSYTVTSKDLGTFMTGASYTLTDEPCPGWLGDFGYCLVDNILGVNGSFDLKCLLPPENECLSWTGIAFGAHGYGLNYYKTCEWGSGTIYDLYAPSWEYLYTIDGTEITSVTSTSVDTVIGGFYYADGIGVAWIKIKTNNHYVFRIYFESNMPIKDAGPPITYNYNLESLSEIMSEDYIVGLFDTPVQPQIYNVYTLVE